MTATRFAREPVTFSPRERLELLCDPGTFRPLRSAVGDGVLSGRGRVAGRAVLVWAQDGAHRGGSLGAAGGETIARTIRAAEESRAPVIGFAHSGGARLQEGAASLHAYAQIFHAQSVATVPQITVVCGPCAGGAAYSPALGDVTIMAGPEARMFLTGPKIVAKVTRESVTTRELGGPEVHGRNGVAQLIVDDEQDVPGVVRDLLAHLPDAAGAPLPLAPPAAPPPESPDHGVPAEHRRVYDVRDVARRLVDGGALLELAPRWARNLVVGFARIEGRPIGIVANQPKHLGGTIDAHAADKGEWFVNLCDRFGVPLLVLVDTPGFLPGTKQEQLGVIRRGAAFLRAFATADVPRVTVTLRQAYGGAHIVMNCRDLGADLTLAWPDANVGVMGAGQAVEIVHRRRLEAGEDAGALTDEYANQHLPVQVAAERGLLDEVIAPGETRARVADLLEAMSP